MSEKCFECTKPAKFVRQTQFAGNHFYCGEHALVEDDFENMIPFFQYDRMIQQVEAEKKELQEKRIA